MKDAAAPGIGPAERIGARAGQAVAVALAPLTWAVDPLVRRGWRVTGFGLWLVLLDAVVTGLGTGLVAASGHLPVSVGLVAASLGNLVALVGRLAAWGLLALSPFALATDMFRRHRARA